MKANAWTVCAALGCVAVLARAPATQQRLGATPAEIVVTREQSAAVERGLAWLAEQQNQDGSWSALLGYKLNSDYAVERDAPEPHVGVSALAGLAFLAGGHLPGRGEYGDVVERTLSFMLGCVQEDGYITQRGSRMYDHAFASLFLAEIYGMTHREDLRSELQKAVDFVVRSQNQEGGWRYAPLARDSDMSIVVCQVLALRAARNIGIRVPKSTVDRAALYVVDSAITEDRLGQGFGGMRMLSEIGAFNYQKNSSSRSSFPLTAAGVTALHGLGIYSDEKIQAGLDYLRRELDEFNRDHGARARGDNRGHYFFWYGHYYGVQAMYQAGAGYWEDYFARVRDEILGLQQPDGSFANLTGPGAAFGTAMAVLILEIPYRFLPIFQR